MSGRGETPREEGEKRVGSRAHTVPLGEVLYTEGGVAVGKVRGYEAGGYFVSTRDGVERLSIEHARSGHDFGEAHLMWRCMNCGEMGRIDDGLPETCPNCGLGKEELMWWTED